MLTLSIQSPDQVLLGSAGDSIIDDISVRLLIKLYAIANVNARLMR